MSLTQSEIDAILKEALKRFPTSNAEWIEQEQIKRRGLYMEIVTEERQRAKVLLEGLRKILHDHWHRSSEINKIAEDSINTYNKNKPI